MSETTTRERPVIARQTSRPATGTDTVVIGLKHPSGLILQHFEKRTTNVATPLGFKAEEHQARVGEPFVLKGNAKLLKLQQEGLIGDSGGYAITPGVPRDLWEEWLHHSAASPLVRNNLIFAEDSEESAAAHGRELAKNRSGLEPIDPEHPEFHVASAHRNVSAIQPAADI